MPCNACFSFVSELPFLILQFALTLSLLRAIGTDSELMNPIENCVKKATKEAVDEAVGKLSDRNDEQFDITREAITGQNFHLHQAKMAALKELQEKNARLEASQNRIEAQNGELREQLGENHKLLVLLSERKAAGEGPATDADLEGKALAAKFEGEAKANRRATSVSLGSSASGGEPSVPSEITMPPSSRKRKMGAERRARSRARPDDDEQRNEMKRLRSERDSATNDLRTLRRPCKDPMAAKARNEERPPASVALSNKHVLNRVDARSKAQKVRASQLFYTPLSSRR